jgi:hypothetical protein
MTKEFTDNDAMIILLTCGHWVALSKVASLAYGPLDLNQVVGCVRCDPDARIAALLTRMFHRNWIEEKMR